VITLQDIFVARPPDEDAKRLSVAAARLLRAASVHGTQAHFLEKLASNNVLRGAELLRRSEAEAAGRRSSGFQAAAFGGKRA